MATKMKRPKSLEPPDYEGYTKRVVADQKKSNKRTEAYDKRAEQGDNDNTYIESPKKAAREAAAKAYKERVKENRYARKQRKAFRGERKALESYDRSDGGVSIRKIPTSSKQATRRTTSKKAKKRGTKR